MGHKMQKFKALTVCLLEAIYEIQNKEVRLQC